MAYGDQDLTAANSVITLQVTGTGATLFPAAFTLQGFSADRIFETEAVEMAETQMGVDGRLSAGFINNPVDQSYTIMPDSPSMRTMVSIANYQRTAQTLVRFNASITLPAISQRYSLTQGVLRQAQFIPQAGRLLEAMVFSIRWQTVLSSPTS